MSNQLKVTTPEQLKTFAEGELVELPAFVEGQRLVVRMRRPSMMVLMKSGRIPNSLLSTANSLFTGNTSKSDILENPEYFKDTLDIMDILAEAALLEPTFKDFKDAGLGLTDEQYMAIFNYTQKGIQALQPFRGE